MYRPPENANRVQAIRSIFENNKQQLATTTTKTIAKQSSLTPPQKLITKSKTELDLRYRCHQNLNRQLSDPSKRNNIKRTPAFRLDKSAICEKTPPIRAYHSKVKHNCDNTDVKNNKCPLDVSDVKNNKCLLDVSDVKNNKCLLDVSDAGDARVSVSDVRSNSCNNESKTSEMSSANVSFLYAEPIPKALRVKKCDTKSDDESYCNQKTLKLKKVDENATPLTDTLKSALKKPLPSGPAPKKPPRTFVHASPAGNNVLPSNIDKQFSDALSKKLEKKPTTPRGGSKKGDPKYMLDKLENMLKKKQNRARKTGKTDSEDSDDALPLFKTRNNTSNTLPNNINSSPSQLFNNLNCLNALGCSAAANYERINEPKSSFFVGIRDEEEEEPVYAEPFQFRESVSRPKTGSKERKKSCKEQRNSLYYMSSPIPQLNENMCSAPPSPEKSSVLDDVQEKQVVACDTSSLSSAYASDVESAEENKQLTPIKNNNNNKIKDIIQVFELRNNNWQQQKPCGKGVDRIKELEHQLRKTLDKTFSDRAINMDTCSENSCSGCSATESSHEDAKDEITNKFETYVKTVRIYAKPGVKRDEHLFDCCLLVGLNKRTAYIKMKFPENVEIPAKIEQLCFPDGIDGPMDRSDKAQCYSLVITDEHGRRTFGYCRRILPEGSENCLPLAYCILSKHRAPRFYKRILQELESRHGLPDKLRDALLSEFYYRQFPRPGETIKIDLTRVKASVDSEVVVSGSGGGESAQKEELISCVIVNNTGEYGTLKKTPRANGVEARKPVRGQSAFINLDTTPLTTTNLKRSASSPSLDKDLELPPTELILALHQDSRSEETGLKDLHCILSTSILQKVFASLLLERKVILVSCVLSKLSSCVEALQSILYPFCWPHTLIPVLPQSLWEIVEAPTPFVCGVLSVAVVNMFRIDNALIVDLDEAAVLSEVGDEDKILPSALVKTWKNGLSVAKSVPVTDSAYSVLLSDAFLRVFIHCCGHYKDYIVNGHFQKEPFIQHLKGKGLRRFLTWFTETTMFCTFLDQVQNDPSSYAIFDKRIQIYGSEESDIILEKMKDWKKEKTLSGFFRFDS